MTIAAPPVHHEHPARWPQLTTALPAPRTRIDEPLDGRGILYASFHRRPPPHPHVEPDWRAAADPRLPALTVDTCTSSGAAVLTALTGRLDASSTVIGSSGTRTPTAIRPAAGRTGSPRSTSDDERI